MARTVPKLRALAEHLIACEGIGNNAAETRVPAAFGSAIEKLGRPLAALMGRPGFDSLLSRALTLAGGKVSWLRTVRVTADAWLECPANVTRLDKNKIAEGEVALMAQLLELLVTFIGESLTLRLVQDVWPAAPIDDLGSDEEGT